MKVKVCGLTDLHEIQQLIAMGVHYLGFIFYDKSPRYVVPYLRLTAIEQLPHEHKIGVFVNEEAPRLAEIAHTAGLQGVQLHGDEPIAYIQHLRELLPAHTQIIKVLRVGKEIPQLAPYAQSDAVDFLLFDKDSHTYGGTGQTFDWQGLNEIKFSKPYILSGGVGMDNVAQVPQLATQPSVLDINSKFERRAGRKNIAQIQEFITQMRHIFA